MTWVGTVSLWALGTHDTRPQALESGCGLLVSATSSLWPLSCRLTAHSSRADTSLGWWEGQAFARTQQEARLGWASLERGLHQDSRLVGQSGREG